MEGESRGERYFYFPHELYPYSAQLDSEELQGFAIANSRTPFVFINSDDWDAPQLFTLVHELAHIWIATSGYRAILRRV